MDCLWEWSPVYDTFSDMPRNNLGMCASWHGSKACQGLFPNQYDAWFLSFLCVTML